MFSKKCWCHKEQELTSLLAIVTRATGSCTWNYCLDKGTLDWGDNMFQIYGVAREQFLGTYEAWTNAVHPDDLAHAETQLNNCIAGHDEFDTEFRIIHPNGQIRHIQALGKTIFDKGVALYVIGINLDITERTQAEEQLQIAATAFEASEVMMVTDCEGTILRVNHAFTTITGYTAEEAVGQNPRILQSGRHDKAFYRAMWEAINSTGYWQGEIFDKRKNGEVYPAWLSISAVKDDSGNTTHYVGVHSDITARKKAEEQIRKLAFFDQITGLPNRRLLIDRLQHAFASSSRSDREGGLLLIDLNNFKDINDTLGHDTGNLLLQQTAQRLESCVRECDTVAHLGGDEFVVMLEDLNRQHIDAAAQTKAVSEKILATLNQPYHLAKHEYHSTASIGVVLFSDHGKTAVELLKRANIAMHQAKKAGRNTLRFFNPKMQDAINTRTALEGELGKALEKQQFHLYYQIQVDSSHHPLGAEALIRWIHPERGMVSPDQFIPLAEDTGLILPIGQWVLETACAQLAEWATRPEMAHLTISVNVSAKQFFQSDFVDQVLAVLNDTGANPQQLKLELTESLLAENVEDIIRKMLTLKTKGVRFSLDDFGTGYSSLSYLGRLPLEQLKIDLSFVRNILTDKNAAAIAKTIVALGESLDMEVIAEGVETEPQREFLASLGCHHYQGYLFSRPLPLEEFEEFVRGA